MTPDRIPRVVNTQYQRVLDAIDTALAGRAVGFPDQPCREGCAACCHGPFDVGPADVWLMLEGIEALEAAARRRAMLRIATAAAEQRRELGADADEGVGVATSGEDRFDEMCDALADQACPLLEDDRCVVYAARPQPCRLVGARYVAGPEELDMDCPVGLTADLPPVSLDFIALDGDVARIEHRLTVPGIGDDRTTIAIGLDSALRRSER